MISKGMENDTLKTSWKGMKRILFLSSRKKMTAVRYLRESLRRFYNRLNNRTAILRGTIIRWHPTK